MVSLKTPPVPSPMSRADFASVEAYIKHLELQIEYGRMKEAIKRMEEEGEKVTETGVDAAEETIVEDVRGGEEAVEEEEEENGVETMFLKGHTNAQNPGKLVIGSKQRFTAQRNKKTDDGHRYFYHCARKAENRGNKAAM